MTAIIVNNQPTEVPDGHTLREFIAAHINRPLTDAGAPADGGRLGVAAAVDGAVVPRSQWNDFTLQPGHSIDLVTAAQGG